MPSSACDWSSDVCSSDRSEEHTSELQSRSDLVCRLLLEKKKKDQLVVLLLADMLRIYLIVNRDMPQLMCTFLELVCMTPVTPLTLFKLSVSEYVFRVCIV